MRFGSAIFIVLSFCSNCVLMSVSCKSSRDIVFSFPSLLVISFLFLNSSLSITRCTSIRYDNGVFILRFCFLFARAEHTSAPTSHHASPLPYHPPPSRHEVNDKRPRARRRRSLQAGRTRRRFPTTVRQLRQKGVPTIGERRDAMMTTRIGGRRRRKHRRPDRREGKGVK